METGPKNEKIICYFVTVYKTSGRVKGHLTINEFAKKCGVHPITVRQWIAKKKLNDLDYVKIGTDYWISESAKIPKRKKYTKKEAKL